MLWIFLRSHSMFTCTSASTLRQLPPLYSVKIHEHKWTPIKTNIKPTGYVKGFLLLQTRNICAQIMYWELLHVLVLMGRETKETYFYDLQPITQWSIPNRNHCISKGRIIKLVFFVQESNPKSMLIDTRYILTLPAAKPLHWKFYLGKMMMGLMTNWRSLFPTQL